MDYEESIPCFIRHYKLDMTLEVHSSAENILFYNWIDENCLLDQSIIQYVARNGSPVVEK